jgi:hypothetical protein
MTSARVSRGVREFVTEHAQDFLVQAATVVELDGRHAHALLEDRTRIHGDGASRRAADVH